MARLTLKAQNNLENLILSCVPRDGEGKTWTEIWEAAKRRGVGSKETFSLKFRILRDAGYVKCTDGRFTRDKPYDLDPEIQDDLDRVLRSPRHIKETPSPSLLFQRIELSYERLLADLAGTNDHKAALEKTDLYLRTHLNPLLQAYSENFWRIRNRGRIKSAAETIRAASGP